MSIEAWEDLLCHQCQGQVFVIVHTIQYHPNLGSHPKEAGMMCSQCQTVVSRGQLIHEAKIRDLIRETESKTAELVMATSYSMPSNINAGKSEADTLPSANGKPSRSSGSTTKSTSRKSGKTSSPKT